MIPYKEAKQGRGRRGQFVRAKVQTRKTSTLYSNTRDRTSTLYSTTRDRTSTLYSNTRDRTSKLLRCAISIRMW